MPPPTSSLTIATKAGIDVSIDGADVYDANGVLIEFPRRIFDNTEFSVAAGAIRVSLRSYGVEIASLDGPAYLEMPRDDGAQLTPVGVGAGANAPSINIDATAGTIEMSATDSVLITAAVVTSLTSNDAVELQGANSVQINAPSVTANGNPIVVQHASVGDPTNPGGLQTTVEVTGGPTGGTFRIQGVIYDLETSATPEFTVETADIAFDATIFQIAAAIQAAIVTVGGYTGAVVNAAGTTITNTFPAPVVLSLSNNSLTGGTSPNVTVNPFAGTGNGTRGYPQGTLWIKLPDVTYVNFGAEGLRPDGSGVAVNWQRTDARHATSWHSTTTPVGATQSADLSLTVIVNRRRADPVNDGSDTASPHMLNLRARTVVGVGGTAAADIVFDFTAIVAELFPAFVIPDLEDGFGFVVIRGVMYPLAKSSACHAAPMLGAANLGATVTLAIGDVIDFHVVGLIYDND